MNDNYYMDDLIDSLERDIVIERYYPLIHHNEKLTEILNNIGVVIKAQVSDAVIEDIRMLCSSIYCFT